MAHIKENWTGRAERTGRVPIDGMTVPPTRETSVRTTGTGWEPFSGATGKATRAITSRMRELVKGFTVGRTVPHTGALSSTGRGMGRELSSIPTVASTKESGLMICNTGKVRSPGPMGQPWRGFGEAANWSPHHPIFRTGLPNQKSDRDGKRKRKRKRKKTLSPLSFRTNISPPPKETTWPTVSPEPAKPVPFVESTVEQAPTISQPSAGTPATVAQATEQQPAPEQPTPVQPVENPVVTQPKAENPSATIKGTDDDTNVWEGNRMEAELQFVTYLVDGIDTIFHKQTKIPFTGKMRCSRCQWQPAWRTWSPQRPNAR